MSELVGESPEVTVIVPAYNAAPWIAQTLRAIQAQTYTRWEVLVADDASTDDTAGIVESFAARDRRIRHLRLPENTGGPAGPRNYALAHAHSPWVAFCDADDLWHPQKLELQLAVAHTESADLVCSALLDFSSPEPPGWLRPRMASGELPLEHIGLWRLLGKNVIPGSSVLCRRTPITSVGNFDQARQLVAVEDYDLWVRLVECGAKIVKIGLPLVHYRRLPTSLSARKLHMIGRALHVLRLHFSRRRQPWLFPLAAPVLMASYALQSVYLRLWRGRL